MEDAKKILIIEDDPDISEIYETMEYSPAPESSDLAMEWIKNHKYKFGLFINGEWTKPKSGISFTTKNPATGEKLATIAEAGDRDVLLSVKFEVISHPRKTAWNLR